MRRPFPALLLLVAALVLLSGAAEAASAAHPSAASAGSRDVDVVKVNGVIDRPMADYLSASLRDAEERGATVIIQLNTSGSLGASAIDLARQVFEATVPVVVWVGPTPAHAMGAGLLLVYASSYAVIAPGAGAGPLQPLDLAHRLSRQDLVETREALAQIARWSVARGRDPSFASEGIEAPGQVLLDRHVVQDFAASSGQLLHKLDGKRVQTGGGPVTLDTSRARLRFHDLGIGGRILHAVASPVTIYVLLVLGMMGIAFELTQAGIGSAGVAGLIAVGLAVYGLVVVPFDAVGLALLVGGLALLSLDVALRRLGPITAAGMAAFVAGSVLVFRGVAPGIDLPVWLIVLFSVGVFLYYGFGLTVAQRSRDRIVSTQRGLVGLVGEARGRMAPEGPVFVKGALWRGRAMDGPIDAGTKVRVRRVDGLILRVEPDPGQGNGPGGGMPGR
jgi:membrane-bound serine protease (ClpP class)